MLKTRIISAAALLMSLPAMATAPTDTIRVTRAIVGGPVNIALPPTQGLTDAAGKGFDPSSLLTSPLRTDAAPSDITALRVDSLPGANVGSLTFRVTASGHAKASFAVTGVEASKVLVDGNEVKDETPLAVGAHRIDVLFASRKCAEPRVAVVSATPQKLTLSTDLSSRPITLSDILDGPRIRSSQLSPDGSMLLTVTTFTEPGGKSTTDYAVTTTSADARRLPALDGANGWMPSSPLLRATETNGANRRLVTFDPRTGRKNVLAENLPEGSIAITPDERSLIITTVVKGPAEGDVYEILEPDDRQPGWRDRSMLSVRDLSTGITRPLTFGNHSSQLLDISADSRKALVMSSRSRLDRRPTTLFTLATIDIASAQADTIVAGDGFIGNALFSPDGTKVLVRGSAESFDGCGRNLPADMTPSMTEGELFVIDLADRKPRPLTRDFNPSVGAMQWSEADGRIYFTAEDGDCVRLYSLDPAKSTFRQVAADEEMAEGFSLPRKGNTLAWFGQSASNSDRLYLTDTRRGTSRRILDPKADMLADVKLGRCEPFDFVNERGDTIVGRYYLPADFDPARKYPVIVNYYGGCSPVGRNFESRYPHHLYAAQGYVVYVLNPSGATGRGQEFAARHVNTAGDGPAQDIIEGTRRFLREHPFADSTKVGCIGASYGGFMTQYLQTQTDIFAAAISHAGISDHTSYWGEGYWGYSYSEVAMANSYPWSHRDLYVDHSPLYNADKVHTPLLFLHGDADHNVPVGESIQMFTALKLLGRPTAFVAVKDQDHHILDYDKRRKWTDTIFAWFAKHLKNDPSAWDALYPPKSL